MRVHVTIRLILYNYIDSILIARTMVQTSGALVTTSWVSHSQFSWQWVRCGEVAQFAVVVATSDPTIADENLELRVASTRADCSPQIDALGRKQTASGLQVPQ